MGGDLREETERRMRELIDDAGLPPPDAVEYGEECIRLFWNEPKLVVVIDEIPVCDVDGADEHARGPR